MRGLLLASLLFVPGGGLVLLYLAGRAVARRWRRRRAETALARVLTSRFEIANEEEITRCRLD